MVTVFECEDTLDGIFTAVYDAWASRLGHSAVRLQVRGADTMQLFAVYRSVVADGSKAERVARTIQNRMGGETFEKICQAAMAKDADKADAIYRVLVLGLSRGVSERDAKQVIWQLQDPNVCHVFELSRKVGHEAHRYMGFVRFRELENGVLFSEISSEHHVLSLIGDHFANRFPQENFLIWNRGCGDCLVHRADGVWFIVLDPPSELGKAMQLSEKEEEMQRLWKGFCQSISIRERENRALQRQMLPYRFQKWMTEGLVS